MKFLIGFLLIPFLSFAHEDCGVPSHDPVLSEDMKKLMDAVALEHWSVSPTKYENAFCKTKALPDYDGWFGQQMNSKLKDRRIKGFRFKKQPEILLDAFRDMMPRSKNWESDCDTVLCAVDMIWGRDLGRKMLYARARHGYNSSDFAFEGVRRFRPSEIDDILMTMSDLPPEMENIGRGGNQRMTLALPGVTHSKTPEAAADATIIFYDAWRTGSSGYLRQYALFHEFGHNVSEVRGDLDDSQEWRALTSCQVSSYGNTNNKEDFTESFVMYRFDGPGLKAKCPAKYDFLKSKAFKGREYLDSSQCGI